MRSCDYCGDQITPLTGSVQLKTDQWKGEPKPDVSAEFCSWKHCIIWLETHKLELLAAKAIIKAPRYEE